MKKVDPKAAEDFRANSERQMAPAAAQAEQLVELQASLRPE